MVAEKHELMARQKAVLNTHMCVHVVTDIRDPLPQARRMTGRPPVKIHSFFLQVNIFAQENRFTLLLRRFKLPLNKDVEYDYKALK
jgi:hypothetical protein